MKQQSISECLEYLHEEGAVVTLKKSNHSSTAFQFCCEAEKQDGVVGHRGLLFDGDTFGGDSLKNVLNAFCAAVKRWKSGKYTGAHTLEPMKG